MAGFKDYKVVLLPASKNKSVVHADYEKAIEDLAKKPAEESTSSEECTSPQPLRAVKYSTFVKLWNKYAPYIVAAKPASDLYGTCRDLTRNVVRAM